MKRIFESYYELSVYGFNWLATGIVNLGLGLAALLCMVILFPFWLIGFLARRIYDSRD